MLRLLVGLLSCLLLVAPSPALCAELARALEPLPVLKPVIAVTPVVSAPGALAAVPTISAVKTPPLLPTLSAERPVEAVVPKVFEASNLDQRASAHEPSAPTPAAPEREHHHGLFGHHHPHSGDDGAAPPPPPGGGGGEAAALKKALLLSGGFVAAELIGGLALDSIALRADALHLTADWALNALALGAMWLANRPGAGKRWQKAEPVVGLVSSAMIGLTALEIAREAIERLAAPLAFSAPAAIGLALCGLVANGLATAVLYKHRSGGLGVRGVFLHALTDAAGSLTVALSSALIWSFGWAWADPVASALIVILISKTAYSLGRQSWKALRQ